MWDRWNGNDTVVESAYRPAGEPWQAPIVISDAPGESSNEGVEGAHDAQSPRIAVDGEGDVTVVWERYVGTNKLQIQAVYRSAGGSWQVPVTIGEVDTMMDPEPWVAVDAQGEATATWTAGGTIYGASKPAGEGWQAPVQLSSNEAFVPQAAVDEQGDATVVWMHYDGSTYIVQSAYKPAGGSWETPTDLSQPGEEGGDPQIALDATGDAMVTWDGHPSEYEDVVRVAYRPSGGSWQAPVDISNEGEQIQSLQVALDAQGDAMVAWAGSGKEVGDIVHAAYRPAGGAWESPTSLSQDGGNAYPEDLVFDAAGNAAILWQRNNGADNILQGDYRPAGGSWETPTDLSKPGSNATDAVLVLDAPGDETGADGDATAVWIAGNDGGCGELLHCVGSYLIQAAGYDINQAPAEEGLEVPLAGTVGTPVEVSIPTADIWSPVLEFGDGTSVSGDTGKARTDSQVSRAQIATDGTTAIHTYSQPGRYEVRFNGTEVLGYRMSGQRTIVIAPAENPTGSEGSGGSKGDPLGSGGGTSEAEGEPSDPLTEDSGTQVTGNGAALDSGTDTAGSAANASANGVAELSQMPRTKLRLALTWDVQERRAILATGTIRVVCHLNAPGVCTVSGETGHGRGSVGKPGSKLILVKLTRAALEAIRIAHIRKLAFVVTARSSGHRVATKAIVVSLPGA